MVCINVRLDLNSYYTKFLLSHTIMHIAKWEKINDNMSANNILQCWAGHDAQTNKSML